MLQGDVSDGRENSCVVVTRGGRGDVWVFPSEYEAIHHPITQYGDALCGCPLDIINMWNRTDFHVLLHLLGDESLEAEVRAVMEEWYYASRSAWTVEIGRYVDRIWRRLLVVGRTPPENPAEIINLIVEDRRKYMSDAAKSDETVAPKPREYTRASIAGHPANAKIKLLTDKDGKKYGKANNPKRGKVADRFALYKDGMTLKRFVELGGKPSDVAWDSDKGYIAVTQ